MPRVKRGFKARRRRNRLLKHAKGYYGARRKVYRVAKQAVTKAELDLADLQAQITDTLITAPFDGEVTAVNTAAGKAVEDLTGVPLGSGHGLAVLADQWLTTLINLWNPGLSKVLLDEDIDSNLRPTLGYVNVFHRKNETAVRVANLG